MDRRFFNRSLLGAAASLSAFTTRAAAGVDPCFDAFEAARASRPWTLGYVGLQADAEPLRMHMHGRLPKGFAGTFYRNGPARHSLGGQRYHHPFDGDGMVQKYEVGSGGVVHAGRFVRTGKFIADSAAGRPVRAAFGTRVPGAEPTTTPDHINVANTSVLMHGGELLALWEGGSATRIDARSLETRGLKTWSPDYAGMPFSAHPKVGPDGTLWNFGVSSAQGLLSVYQVKASGELAQAATLPLPHAAMVHDFAVTEHHLVFLLPPLVFDRARLAGGESFLDSHVWRPELGMRVLVLPKDGLDAPKWFELPAGFVFHIGNAWEAEGRIRLDYMRSPSAWNATTGLKALMQGRFEHEGFPALTLLTLDLNTGRAGQEVLDHVAEFPRVDPRVVGQRHRQLYVASRVAPGERPGYDAVMRFHPDSGRTDLYRYGASVLVEEHLFVPRPGGRRAEGEGWLVGTALDVQRGQTLFSVFDAQRLAAGPLAQATMPRLMPFGLHGTFVPA